MRAKLFPGAMKKHARIAAGNAESMGDIGNLFFLQLDSAQQLCLHWLERGKQAFETTAYLTFQVVGFSFQDFLHPRLISFKP
jgi:hypothetical protein